MSSEQILFLALDAERIRDNRKAVEKWIKENLLPRIEPSSRERVISADEYLEQHLNRYLNDPKMYPDFGFLSKIIQERPYLQQRWMAILKRWVSHNQTFRAAEICGAFLMDFAKRDDLEILQYPSLSGDVEALEKLRLEVAYAVRLRSLS